MSRALTSLETHESRALADVLADTRLTPARAAMVAGLLVRYRVLPADTVHAAMMRYLDDDDATALGIDAEDAADAWAIYHLLTFTPDKEDDR